MKDRTAITIIIFLIVAIFASVFLMAALPSTLTFAIFVSTGALGMLFFAYETFFSDKGGNPPKNSV